MEADGLLRTVRGQVGAGRTLPLGGPGDGAWITERAAVRVLREAERAVPGVRLTTVGIGLADPEAHDWGAVRTANPAAPPSALPAGALRIAAEVAARADRPLPRTAEVLRPVLAAIAQDRLGLAAGPVDLRFTGLLADAAPAEEEDGGTGSGEDSGMDTGMDPDGPPDAAGADGGAVLDAAARAVPGVLAAVTRWDGRGARVRLAVAAGYRALDVAVAVRAAVVAATAREAGLAPGDPAGPAVAVLVADAR